MLGAVISYSFFLLSYPNNSGYKVARVMSGGESNTIPTQREQSA